VLIEARQAIKCKNAISIKVRKTQKTSVNQVLFETITSFREYLVSIIKASKSIFKILVDKDVFSNLALSFVLQNSKLLKCYAKKFETIKTNLIVH